MTSTKEVVEALKNITEHHPNFSLSEFLLNHGVQSLINNNRPLTKLKIIQFCSSTVLLDAVIHREEDNDFNDLFETSFGCGQDWRNNWTSISTDLLHLQHFLSFQSYYSNSKSINSLLQDNLGLQVCEDFDDPLFFSSNIVEKSINDIVTDRLTLGGENFVSNHSENIFSIQPEGTLCRIPEGHIETLFIRDEDLDDWGIPVFQGKIVDVSDMRYLNQLRDNHRHIDVDMVKYILKSFFLPNGHGVFQQPDGSLKLCLNLTPAADANGLKSMLLTSYTQNGKTNQIIALTWIFFFCHGYGTYILCRSDAQEYHVLTKAIDDFNAQLFAWARDKPGFNGDIRQYLITPLPLSHYSLKQLEDFKVTDHNNNLKCICRIRLLQASNASRAKDEIRFLNNQQQLGVVGQSNRQKFAVIIDEAQNARQTLEVEKTLERAVVQLLEDVAICVEVSATQEASLILQTSEFVDMLFIPAKPDYFGYAQRLPSDRQIDIVALEEYFRNKDSIIFTPPSNPTTMAEMIEYGQAGIVQKLIEEPLQNPRHWLCVVSAGKNAALDGMGTDILRSLNQKGYNEPVIIVVAIASFTQNGRSGGATILFNEEAARDMTKEDIEKADRCFYITEDDIKGLSDFEKTKLVNQYGPRLKKGFVIEDPQNNASVEGAQRFVTYLSRRCTVENVQVSKDPNRITKVSLPRIGGYYRLRTQLSLVEQLMQNQSRPYSVITIGNRLIREGITPKTAFHTLAPEKMFCLYPRKGFEKRTVIALTQTMGRLCGLRKNDEKPTLYLLGDCMNLFKSVIAFNDDLMHVINEFQNSCTVEEIVQGNGHRIHNLGNPMMRNVYAHEYWPQLPFWPGIVEMRQYTTAQYRDASSFENLKRMIDMLLFMEEERVDDDFVEDWYYANDFRGKKTENRAIMELFFDPNCKPWVDQSSADGNYKTPVAVRRFPQNSEVGIRLNCRPRGILQGMIVCTCESSFEGFIPINAQYSQCHTCKLYCHDQCQPCERDGENLFCGRCCRGIKRKHTVRDIDDLDEEEEKETQSFYSPMSAASTIPVGNSPALSSAPSWFSSFHDVY